MTVAAAASQHLPGVLHGLEPTLNHYGYLAVAGLVLIEDFGVPVRVRRSWSSPPSTRAPDDSTSRSSRYSVSAAP